MMITTRWAKSFCMNNEVVSYSMLIKEVKTDLISAVGAVEALYYPDYLKKYSKIKSAELGYFTQYPLASAQIFVPVWRIEVERKTDDKTIHEEFIVDARDGALLQSQEKRKNHNGVRNHEPAI